VNRPAGGRLVLLGGSLALVSMLQAQQPEPSRKWGVGLGAGITIPAGAYSSTDNPGAHALMYFSYSPLPAFGLGLDVGTASTPHKAGGHTNLDEVMLGAVWRPAQRAASPRPFLLASIGAVALGTDNPSKGRFAWGGGGGISIGRGAARLFLEARFLRVQTAGETLSVIPVTLGFATLAP
jgi:hypothetical protein